jgi:hypothetical protein
MSSQTDSPGPPLTAETIRIFADFSIRRGCAFALLAIACIMLSFTFDIQRSFHIGAVLFAAMAVTLWIKSLLAPRLPYFRTHLWIMLPERPRMNKPQLQRLIGSILAERFWWHAKAAALIAAGLGTIAALIWLNRQFW